VQNSQGPKNGDWQNYFELSGLNFPAPGQVCCFRLLQIL